MVFKKETKARWNECKSMVEKNGVITLTYRPSLSERIWIGLVLFFYFYPSIRSLLKLVEVDEDG